MNSLTQLGQRLKLLWQGMSPARRTVTVAVLLLGVVGILAFAYWASQPNYQVLFSGLAPEDSGAITAKLQAEGVPYKLDAGGTTILVSADKLQQIKVQLAADGLPIKGGRGFELFDGSSFGMTPFTQQVNYLRALQSELARTITQIDPILSARVHIVRPEPTPFIREQKPTTASVVVRLRSGAALNRNISAGIVSLVARSVEGLTRDNVTIVDSNGRVLSEEVNPDTGPIGSHLEYRRELENYLSSRAETMLSKVVGTGRVIVRVTADLNFQRHREKKETYNPDGRVVAKEIINSSKSTTPQGSKGAAGTSSNLGKGASGQGGTGNSSDETVQTDYAISKITQEFEEKLGSIERLTVAAFVDLSGGTEGKVLVGLNMIDAEGIIKQAVGFKTGRDEIKVTNVQLKVTEPLAPAEESADTGPPWQNILSLVRYISLAIAALAVLGIAWRVFRRLAPPPRVPSADKPDTAKEVAKDPIVEKLNAVVEQNPDALAAVLEKWLANSEPSRRMAA